MALFGRVGICGLITVNYEHDELIPRPDQFDQVLMKRLKITGFFSPDFYHRGPEVNKVLRPWYEAGELKMTFDETPGLERTPEAYTKLFTGAKIGKSLVRVADPSPYSGGRPPCPRPPRSSLQLPLTNRHNIAKLPDQRSPGRASRSTAVQPARQVTQ